MSTARVHWQPTTADAEASQLASFLRFCGAQGHGPEGEAAALSATALHAWSLRHRDDFWRSLMRWSEIPHEGSLATACTSDVCEDAVWFPDVSLSYAEAVLARWEGSDETALLGVCEGGSSVRVSGRELVRRVRAVAASYASLGLRPGSAVAAILPNGVEAVIGCLAAAAVGAVWCSLPQDLGGTAVTSRLEQVRPRLLLVQPEVTHQGVTRPLTALTEILERVDSLEAVALVGAAELEAPGSRVLRFEELEAAEGSSAWRRFPFNHPLYVLFSSGTTGVPKCIVHGAGGSLLEHVKEHRLHSDLGEHDCLYFHTTCGWMMWNWQLSALAGGTKILLYDGSPTYPERDALWRVVERHGVTVLGTSPTYLQYCQDVELEPAKERDLSTLRLVQSTGSVLHAYQYDWLARHVGRLPLHSISGGTDIVGCFVLGLPHVPVHVGASQSLSLALDVQVLAEAGREAEVGEAGELVCANPFPSRPIGFLGDDGPRRFHEAYFAQNEGVWTHGDHAVLTAEGGACILGRSDGVFNIRGVRIGSSEIHRVVLSFTEVAGAVAVEQRHEKSPGGSRIVLLVVLGEGETLERPLVLRLKKTIKEELSATHVPAVVAAVSGLPTTFSGKLSESAVRRAVAGDAAVNAGALRNPETLDEIARAMADHP